MINHQPCSVEDTRGLIPKEEGPPVDIAVNPITHIVYIANSDSKDILAIDCNKQKITVVPIPTNGTVRELNVDPSSNKVYAVIPDTKNILIIDGNDDLDINDIGEMVDDLSKGRLDEIIYDKPEFSLTYRNTTEMPVAVDVNPRSGELLIASNRSNTIYTIDKEDNISKGPVLKNINPQDIAFNPKTGKLYAPNNRSDIISVIDSKNGTLLKNITGVGATKDANSFVVNSNTNKIYITNPTLQKVSVIDGKKDIVIKNIPVGRYPFKIAFDSSDNRIYVAHKLSNAISIIDGNKDQVIQILLTSLENNVELNSIAVDSKTHLLYLGFKRDDGSESVSIVNPATSNNTYIQVAQQPIDLEFNVKNSKL